MTAKTSTEKARTLRDKRAREGLAEVRGVWAPKDEHAAIKQLIAQRMRKEGKK